MKGNEACARKCIKGGSPAVLLTPKPRSTSSTTRPKSPNMPGHKVVVTGALNGDTIKVESIKIDSGCIPGPTGCQ